MENQSHIFIVFILNGFLIGILFDIFRVLRRSFKTSDILTMIEDIIFWILTGFILLFSIFKFNNGQIRFYLFLGLAIGVSLYILLFSKVFIKTNVYIINIIKKFIKIILIKPIKLLIKFLKKIIFKPISFIFINFKKILSKLKIKQIKLFKSNKKNNYKQDLI